MVNNNDLESGASSWERNFQTTAINQNANSSDDPIVMNDDHDDDRHWRDGYGSSD